MMFTNSTRRPVVKRTDHVFVAAQAGPLVPCQSTLFVNRRSPWRSCHDWRLSVSNAKECKLALFNRLTELYELIFHIYTLLHPERIANPVTHDNKHTLQNVVHDESHINQFALASEQSLMANEHPESEDVPEFSGKINENFVEWVTDVRLREAKRIGLLGQPRQIIKTLLG